MNKNQRFLYRSMSCTTGGLHTVMLSADGKMYSFGSNESGQMGFGSNFNFSVTPKEIPGLPRIKQVSCGERFTVCIDLEGIMWSFGDNDRGQLGTGDKKCKYHPQAVSDIPPVQFVSCGEYHTLALTIDETLWSFGSNFFGQLCLGHKEDQMKPKQTSFSNISKICEGGWCHTLIQNNKGEILGCGRNEYGQLGLAHNEDCQIECCIIPNQPPNIIQFSSGYYHSLFLDIEGNVFSVGRNESGQLGLGHKRNKSVLKKIPKIPKIQTISCVGRSSFLLDVDGNVWSFGKNYGGQLGHGNTKNLKFPTKISSINDIKQISCGSYGNHFFAKDYQNKIYSIGLNNKGQLGATANTTKYLATPELMNEDYFEIWGDIPKIQAKSARK